MLRVARVSQSRFSGHTEQLLLTCALILISSWGGWMCSKRTQASSFWITTWWRMRLLCWMMMMMVIMYLSLESWVCMNSVQLLQEDIKIRTHVNKVCSVWPLNLDWDALAFLNIRFAIFLKISLVFLVNMHFLICCKSVQNLVIRSCHLHCLVPNLATRLCHSRFHIALECPIDIIS